MEPAANSLPQCTFEDPHPGCRLVRITGELDACSVPDVESRIAANLGVEPTRVILDLSDLAFLDSTGIRMLLHVHNDRRQTGGVVIVPPAAGVARRAFELVGMASMVPTVETVGQALLLDQGLDRGSLR